VLPPGRLTSSSEPSGLLFSPTEIRFNQQHENQVATKHWRVSSVHVPTSLKTEFGTNPRLPKQLYYFMSLLWLMYNNCLKVRSLIFIMSDYIRRFGSRLCSCLEVNLQIDISIQKTNKTTSI
jgi:hypothetical protein